jgi:hypothetical protein
MDVETRVASKPVLNRRQIRLTAVCGSFASFATVRVLQCVAFIGCVSSVLAITASTRASSIVRGAPDRGASSSPSSRDSRNARATCTRFALRSRVAPRRLCSRNSDAGRALDAALFSDFFEVEVLEQNERANTRRRLGRPHILWNGGQRILQSSMVLIQQTAHGTKVSKMTLAAGLRVEFIQGEDDQEGRMLWDFWRAPR